MDPLSPARYCECCGRELSPHQKEAGEADKKGGHAGKTSNAAEVDDWAPKGSAWDLRCPSCGGPSLDGGRCQPCQKADAAPAKPAAALSEAAKAAAKGQPVDKTLSYAALAAAASASGSTETAPRPSTSPSVSEKRAMLPIPEPKTVPAILEAPAASPDKPAGADPDAGPNAKVVWSGAAPPKRPKIEAVPDKKPARPAAVNKRPSAPAAPERTPYWLSLAAAAVIVAAIGFGAWLSMQEEPVMAREGQPVALVAEERENGAANGEAAVEDLPLPKEHPVAAPASPGRESVTTLPSREPAAGMKPRTANRPKPATPARSTRATTPAAKPVRVAAAPAREVPAAPSVNPEAPAPAAAPSARDVVAAAPKPAAPEAPVGPFFETTDVNETPRVATRVEPRLPDELRARQINEIVIVRALVSQSGHPTRISVLRRSRTGPQLDNVVVAAVNQWTFTPARKKGEPVSCWFNFGVPVGRGD
jgi:TonB family protein